MALMDDQRSFPRIQKNLKIGVQDPDKKYFSTMFKDFSVGGLSFASKESARNGIYTFYIPYLIRQGLHVLAVNGTVAYCVFDLQSREHTVGIKFSHVNVQTFNRLEFLADRLYDLDIDLINEQFDKHYAYLPPKK